MESVEIEIGRLEPNRGQIEGLPRNPRFIRDKQFEKLKQSIVDDPEMLALRELIVVPHGGRYVIVGGNMRYRACKELGYDRLPCKVMAADTPAAKLRAITMKDNIAYGADDFECINLEWNCGELSEWGFEFPADFFAAADGGSEAECAEDSEVKNRAGWNTAEDAKESVCDLQERITLYRRNDLLFTSIFKKTAEGLPLSTIKAEEYVALFAEKALFVLRGLLRFGSGDDWCVVTTPKRRHRGWNFSEEVCKRVAAGLCIPFHADVFEARTRARICPDIRQVQEVAEKNVILFDDILTTGSTVRAIVPLLSGKNVVTVIGINNN